MFKSPLVVGYKGEIGSFILQGLLRTMPKASNIWCFDINDTEKEKLDRIKKCDIIFLCVPLEETIHWLLKYKKYFKNKIIIEQTSLKSTIFENTNLKNLNIWSMHILFRPSATPNKEDRRIAFIKEHDTNWHRIQSKIEKITESKTIWFNTWQAHDYTMAIEQALVHRTILVLRDALAGVGHTYLSQRIIELYNRIKAGDTTLYNQIQQNKGLPIMLSDFITNMKKIKIKGDNNV